MANMIILNKNQAENIRGRYGKYSALDPVALPDGNFMLPEDCLQDPDLKDAQKKLQEAKDSTGTKELTELSKATAVKAGEYYIDDITLVPDDPAEAPASTIVKCIKDSAKISITDTKIFLKS